MGMVGHGLATPEATVRSSFAHAIFIGALLRVLEMAQEWLHRCRSMRGRSWVYDVVLGRNLWKMRYVSDAVRLMQQRCL